MGEPERVRFVLDIIQTAIRPSKTWQKREAASAIVSNAPKSRTGSDQARWLALHSHAKLISEEHMELACAS